MVTVSWMKINYPTKLIPGLTFHSRGPVSAEHLRLECGSRRLVQFAAGLGHEDGRGGLQPDVGEVLPDQAHHLVIWEK